MKYDRRNNDRRKDRVNFMVVDREVKKETKGADEVCRDKGVWRHTDHAASL